MITALDSHIVRIHDPDKPPRNANRAPVDYGDMATSRRLPAADTGTSTRERVDTSSASAFGKATSLRTRSYMADGGNVQGGGSRHDWSGSSKTEVDFDSLKVKNKHW